MVARYEGNSRIGAIRVRTCAVTNDTNSLGLVQGERSIDILQQDLGRRSDGADEAEGTHTSD